MLEVALPTVSPPRATAGPSLRCGSFLHQLSYLLVRRAPATTPASQTAGPRRSSSCPLYVRGGIQAGVDGRGAGIGEQRRRGGASGGARWRPAAYGGEGEDKEPGRDNGGEGRAAEGKWEADARQRGGGRGGGGQRCQELPFPCEKE
jgi:hypothetical protein